MRRGKQPEECGTDWRESRSSVTPWGTEQPYSASREGYKSTAPEKAETGQQGSAGQKFQMNRGEAISFPLKRISLCGAPIF